MPFLAHQDCFFFFLFWIDCVSLTLCILYDFFHDFWMKCVHDVEHVFSIALSSFCILFWKVLCHILQFQKSLIQVFYRYLIILWHLDMMNLLQFHQLLLAFKDIFQETMCCHLISWHIILKQMLKLKMKNLLGDDLTCNRRDLFYLRTSKKFLS